MTRASGRPIDAVLGGDILNAMAIMVQPDKKLLSMVPSGAITIKGPDTITIPLLPDSRINAELHGQPVILQVDLGYSGVVRLTDVAWHRIFSKDYPTTKDHNVTADGIVTVNRTTKAELNIGLVNSRNAPVSDGYPGTDGADGLIGAGFFLKRTTEIDVPMKEIVMIITQAEN